jgi:hypothetical protein
MSNISSASVVIIFFSRGIKLKWTVIYPYCNSTGSPNIRGLGNVIKKKIVFNGPHEKLFALRNHDN